VLETKKVRDLLSRIKAPELAAAKQQVRATDHLVNSFEEAASFLALSIIPLKVSTHQVAGATTTQDGTGSVKSGNEGRGGRGGGRGHGRGESRGRGQRGRGRPRTTYYSPEEWYNLSQDQGSQILDARSSTSSDGNSQRQVRSVATSGHDDASTLTTPTTVLAAVASVPAEAGGNAGNQFGQRSRSIGVLNSSERTVSQVHSDICQSDRECFGMLELDSHTDTCTVGSNCRIIAVTEKSCNVAPYHPKYKLIKNCPIVQAATGPK
jgi:hypothetical protein